MKRPIHASDLTFLNMDRPSNLMVVNGVMWFADVPDWDAVRDVLRERLVDRFPVLSCRPVRDGRSWAWEDDPDFDLDRHVRHVSLEAADLAAAQEYLAGRVSQPLDRTHPMWEFDLIDGFDGHGQAPRAMVLARFHHCLADGIRIVQLILGLCDVADGAVPTTVGRAPSGASVPSRAAGVTRQFASDLVDYAGGVASVAATLPRRTASLLGRNGLAAALDVARRPVLATDALTGAASEGNRLLNNTRALGRLALARMDATAVNGTVPGVEKRLGWVTGIDMARVKGTGSAHGATVNDVLLAVVARALGRYLTAMGRSVDDVNWLIPVSLKPFDMNLPAELGNHFALVMFPMPLDVGDPDTLMHEIRTRMNRIKNSAEPMMIFGLQRLIAATPAPVSVRITSFVANKTLGVLTNVPGPRAPMYLAGTEVTGVLGWVPTAADQSLGLCIFSYNGTVSIGIASDAAIFPDPGHLADLIDEEFAALAASTPEPIDT